MNVQPEAGRAVRYACAVLADCRPASLPISSIPCGQPVPSPFPTLLSASSSAMTRIRSVSALPSSMHWATFS